VKKTLCLTTLALAWLAAPAAAEAPKTGFLDRVYKAPDGKEYKYVLFVPAAYSPKEPAPVILFLHGAGERGTDGKRQANVGIGKAIKKDEKSFPFITVMPQAEKTWKAGSEDADRALAILEEVQKEYKTDPKRVCLTGLSMGGVGTWSLAAKYPDRWAAIVPICGPGDVATAAAIKDLPCWCFWGDKDNFANKSMPKMVEALKDAGGKPKFTEYPGVGHNSWDMAYGTKELYDWLIMQKK
jgi:predicted peptidase